MFLIGSYSVSNGSQAMNVNEWNSTRNLGHEPLSLLLILCLKVLGPCVQGLV